jgi:hypothetical protein
MGHDITARLKKGNEKVSHISIGAFDQPKAWILYESLNSNDCNGGLSGIGTTRFYTSEELETALQKFLYLKGEPESEIASIVESSEQYNETINVINTIMRVFGGPKQNDPELKLSEETIESVEKFLRSIQFKDGVFIEYY